MNTQRNVAKEWYHRVALTQHGHYLAALHFARLHFWVGIPVVLLTAIVGTSVFAGLQQQPITPPQNQQYASLPLLVGLLSISATVLAALQTFLNYNERAEKHRVAGARYGALGRRLELMLAQDSDWSGLEDTRKQLDALAQENPNIPKAVHKAMTQYRPQWYSEEAPKA